ncbi:MAG TPA: zinc-binding dehydrogenase [Rectinemataceae bacterium]|nr:zinc-binding dehydrogenase [Rectinemataceae bacterium]
MKTTTIRRLVFTGPLQATLEVSELDGPIPPRSVLVRSERSLLSPGTELALYTGTHIGFKDPEIAWARYPLYPGYATVGVVTALGSGLVADQGFPSLGDRILHYKPHAEAAIIDVDRDFWLSVPQGMKSESALFARFAQIARTAVEASRAEGDVLVFGAGIIGNLTGQLFRELRHVNVLIADPSAERLALAVRCGFVNVIDNSTGVLSEAIAEMTGKRGVSVVIEATGIPSLVIDSLLAVNRLGEVVLLGSSRGKVELDVYKLIHRKATSLVGAHEGRYPQKAGPGKPSQEMFARDALDQIDSGALIVEPFLTDRIVPEGIPAMYDTLLKDGAHHVGVVVEWEK